VNFKRRVLFWTFYHYIRYSKNSFIQRLKLDQIGKNAGGASDINPNDSIEKNINDSDKAFLCLDLFTSLSKSIMINNDGTMKRFPIYC
jgi:hypothetical protein